MRLALRQHGVRLPELDGAWQTLDFNTVYRAHVRTVTRWARHLGGPAMDVEDVVQEVFVVVHKELPRFVGRARLGGWLFHITNNAVRHRRRKDAVRRWLHISTDDVSLDIESTSATPDELVEQRQSRELVYRALEALPERYRTVVVLFELEGLSGEEIAELVDVNLSTLWVWLHRGRAMLAKRFAELSEGALR